MESGHKRIYYLDFKNLNAEAILSDLKDSPWDSAFVFDDADDRLDRKFIDNLSSSKAAGADEITVKVLKLVSPVFVQPLRRLINLSIMSGCFPTKWKLVRVTPFFKDGA